MFRFIKEILSRFFNSNYEGLQQGESITINENQEGNVHEEDFAELKEEPIIPENSYSEALQKLVGDGDGYDLVTLHGDAIGNMEIIGDDQELRTEYILKLTKNEVMMEDINMKLVESIKALNLEDVLTCLNSGADYKKPDLSVVDKNGNTVLHKLLSQNISAYFDYVQDDKLHIMDTLIKLGAPVDVPNDKGEFSIHFAAVRGDFMVVQKLESIKPCFINSTTKAGETPLMLSIKTGKYLSPEFILSMLKIGVAVKVGDKSAYDIAKKIGKIDIIKALTPFVTEADEKEIETDVLIMNKLINYYNAEELSDLIEKSGLNVNIKDEEGLSLISSAIYAKKPELVKVLLQHGASLATGEYGTKHPLVALTMQEANELAEIVCHFANPAELSSELNRNDIFLSSPTYLALQQGKIGIVKIFLQHGSRSEVKKGW
ncbi:unnamed protein product [Rotaria magnacalcarata]|uniref:Uncharacterized protein n=1 Tax=Rotaria magnacalcarata TaxID=392030 RepID=A0A816ZUI8_9BILA|nr:unnamed protein product [Rotaria magnacalcarata]